MPDGEVDGLGPEELLQAVPQPRAPADVRRALGRSTTGKAGSEPMRSSGTTRRCRPVPHSRSRSRTGSSRAIASRRSASCAECRHRRCSPGGAAIPAGWWNPVDSRSRRSACRSRRGPPRRRVRVGSEALKGRSSVAIALLRRRRDLRRRIPRGRHVRRRAEGAGRSSSATTTSGRSRRRSPRRPRRRRSPTRRPATGCRASASTEATFSRSTRRRETRSARAGRRRPDVHRGGDVPRGAARDRRRPSLYIDAERVEEERENECVGRFERYLRRAGSANGGARGGPRAEALELMRAGIAEAEAEPPADPGLVFEHAYVEPPPSHADDLAELQEDPRWLSASSSRP